jgi:hypothetical protein
MKKFIVSSRGAFVIMEVEGEYVKPLEDPSVKWLPQGEYRFRIMKPSSLHEKLPDGTTTPAIYFSFALFDTVEDAKLIAEKYIRSGFDFEIRKGRLTSYTEEEVQLELSKMGVQRL